jgi:hypothetical protein
MSEAKAPRALLVCFGLLLVAGCAMRFWRLGEVGLWYDELWSVVGASDRPLSEVYREWMAGDPHPPGYFLFFFAWFKVFPNDEFWARIPSALAGVATVAYLLFGTRRVLSLDERVMSASFAGLSHAYVLYALTAKQYALMLLGATVMTVAYLELTAARRFDRGVALRFYGSAVVLAWLNYFATVYAALLGLAALVLLRGDRTELKRGLSYSALAALAGAPLLWFQYLMLRYTPGDWQHDSFRELAADFLPHLFFVDPLVPAFAAALAIAALLSIVALRPELRTARNGHLLGVTVGIVGFLLLAGAFKPIFFIRYFLIAFPALLLGLGVLTAAAFPLRSAWLAVLPLAFFTRAAVVEFRHADGLQRQAWNKSVDLVLAAKKPGDVVCVLGASQDKTMLEYLQAGDEWSLYYVRNLSFYRYYFRRRGADELASELTVVQPSRESAADALAKHRAPGRTLWVLGGHHLKYSDEAAELLRTEAREYEMTQLFSTRVYRVAF